MTYVGIIGRLKKDKRNCLTFNEEVVHQITKHHITPIGIIVDFEANPCEEFNRVKPLLDLCNGFILQGGSEYFDIDILITKYLHCQNIPTLGICLGMQTMAMAFNGIMSTIGPSHNKNFNYVHDIDIEPCSKLYEIIKKPSIGVNSRHNDYIVSTTLNVSAQNEIIEAIEDPNKDFFIGVQWHPESLQDENTINLFQYFFETIKKVKK